jgi:asparagine synthase (glutamine-hydrolysing)
MHYWPVSDDKISFDYKVTRFLQGSLMPPGRAHLYWNGTFTDDEKQSLLNRRSSGALQKIIAELRSLPPTDDDLAPYLWLDQRYFLADDILTKSDRMSMAHSVEVRPPFLDHRVVEFAAKLPAHLKIRGKRQKFLLKELMKEKLPPAILQRKKIGFDIPAHEWLRGPLRALLLETLQEGLSTYSDLFRREVVERFVKQHLERKANLGYHLWGLLILFLWMKKWRIRTTGAATTNQLLEAKAGSLT